MIITADHGGHENTHGCNIEEDMTIPIMFFGENFQAGKELKNISLLDIAPTIAEIMSVPIPAQWHGKSILSSNNKR